jgi:hypothetical protein
MVAAVVLENQPRLAVVQIGSANEPASSIMEVGLDLRPRQG